MEPVTVSAPNSRTFDNMFSHLTISAIAVLLAVALTVEVSQLPVSMPLGTLLRLARIHVDCSGNRITEAGRAGTINNNPGLASNIANMRVLKSGLAPRLKTGVFSIT
ncbi:hypothetical protein PMIN03_011103 [Paraphaeosphaeria minitans]